MKNNIKIYPVVHETNWQLVRIQVNNNGVISTSEETYKQKIRYKKDKRYWIEILKLYYNLKLKLDGKN